MNARNSCRIAARWRLLLLLGMSALLPACASSGPRFTKTPYKGFPNAWRITNDSTEVVVVPELGRIVGYRLIDGQNVLWENLAAPEDPTYRHFGGDKVWPWPQAKWTSGDWPPPPGVDPLNCHASVVGRSLVLRSELIPGYGLRLVRELRLADSGTELTITSRFEKLADGRDDPVAAWAVTQVPSPDLILARLLPDSALPERYLRMGPTPAGLRFLDDLLVLRRDPNRSAKIGCDADLLAALLGDTLFVQKLDPERTTAGTYVPGHRAQVYTDADRQHFAAAGVGQYIELEFTSPLKPLAIGDSVTLCVTWSLHRLSPEQRRPDRLAQVVRKL